jgi:hypothetical protein
MRTQLLAFCVASSMSVLAIGGCNAVRSPRPGQPDTGVHMGGDGGGPSMCAAGVHSICRGTSSVACNADGTQGASTDCSASGGVCVANMGCRACTPNMGMCNGQTVMRCRPDGSGFDTVMTCDPATGAMCSAALATCTSPCADAAANGSYIGCEYWPVATLNNELDRATFHFAVAVANPGTMPANITVTHGGTTVATATVGAGMLQTIQLPWDATLQPAGDMNTGITPSVMSRNAAYHLVSTMPVTVYQFNPLEFSGTDATGMAVNSFTNDASLLLPTQALTGNYIVLSRPTHQLHSIYHPLGQPRMVAGDFTGASPGFLTLVGVAASSDVTITFTAHTIASTDGQVQAFAPGQTGMFTLAQGDVLQITTGAPATCAATGAVDRGQRQIGAAIYDVEYHYCTVGSDYDLSGTLVRSTGALELIAGHNCDFVPSNRWACDHLEQGIFPVETWGHGALVVATQPLRGEPNVVRVISSTDGNALTFDPPSVQAAMTLNRGQFIEFEASQSFQVTGTQALMVGQFLVGQDYNGFGSTQPGDVGDPSFSLAIPTEQYRSQYTFLTPSTYPQSWVGISMPMGANVMLDNNPVTNLVGVGSTGFGTTNVMIPAGPHNISGDMPFGIVVYGFAPYTSYMYPGGLDLHHINAPI